MNPILSITAVARPFLLTFHATGQSYPLTSEGAQNLLDSNVVVTATRNRVVLAGHNTADPKQRATLRPATLGGGPAFVVRRAFPASAVRGFNNRHED